MKAFKATVRGMVQGVGFRFFVERVANHLGVTGYVRNTPDGSVEVVACGSDEPLKELIEKLRAGPSFSSVSGVNVKWLDYCPEYQSFGIRF